MTADTGSSVSKRRKRRARAALILFRRRLTRICSRASSAQDFYDKVKSYLDPVLQAYPDVIPEGSRSRLESALGLAEGVQGNLEQACNLLHGEVDGLIQELAGQLGIDDKARDWMGTLTSPLAGLLEASPFAKAVVATLVVVLTGGAITGAMLTGEGSEGPRDPEGVVSVSHQTGAASTDNTIDVTWEPEPTAAGYSVQWTAGATDLPDTTVDVDGAATSVTSPALAPGSWYFHLRTQNKAGAWTSTVHAGPFVIQTLTVVPTATPTPPPSPTATSTVAPLLVMTATPVPPPPANRPPTVSAITAEFSQPEQTTRYRVTATDPEGAALTLDWSGLNCGTSSRIDNGRTLVWSHPHVPGDPSSCPPTSNHADVTIALRVSDGVNVIACSYPGAASGVGQACR